MTIENQLWIATLMIVGTFILFMIGFVILYGTAKEKKSEKEGLSKRQIYLEVAKLPLEAKKYMGEEAFKAYHEKIEAEYDASH